MQKSWWFLIGVVVGVWLAVAFVWWLDYQEGLPAPEQKEILEEIPLSDRSLYPEMPEGGFEGKG